MHVQSGTRVGLIWYVVLVVMWTLRVVASLGSTPSITAIYEGRCETYRQCVHGWPCPNASMRDVSCSSVVSAFFEAFAYKDPRYSPFDAYDDLLELIPPWTSPGTTEFWSGTQNFAVELARISKQYTSVEETFPGYLVNNLTWCGKLNGPGDGIDYVDCPSSYDYPNETSYTFWRRISQEFAKQAEGEVYVILNATRPGGAFSVESTFANYELPNLDPNKVTVVNAYLVDDFTHIHPDIRFW